MSLPRYLEALSCGCGARNSYSQDRTANCRCEPTCELCGSIADGLFDGTPVCLEHGALANAREEVGLDPLAPLLSVPCPRCLGDTRMLPADLEEHLRNFHGESKRESREVLAALERKAS